MWEIGVVVVLALGFVEEVGLAVVLSRTFAGCGEDFCCLVSSSLSGCVDDPSHDVLLSRLMVCVLISFAVFGESARFSFSSIAFSFESIKSTTNSLHKTQTRISYKPLANSPNMQPTAHPPTTPSLVPELQFPFSRPPTQNQLETATTSTIQTKQLTHCPKTP